MLAGSVLVTTLVVGAEVWLALRSAQRAFLHEAERVAALFQRRVHESQALLKGLVAIQRVSGGMNAAQLSTYAGELLASYPHAYAVAYLARHPRATGESGLRNEPAAPVQGHRSEPGAQLSVVFAQPQAPGGAALLGNGAAVKAVSAAVERALDRSRAVASKPVTLPGDGTGYWLVEAVHPGGLAPEAESAGGSALLAAVLVRADQLIPANLAFEHPTQVMVDHYSFGSGEMRHRLLSSGARGLAAASPFPGFREERRLAGAAQPFVLTVRAQPGWEVLDPYLIAATVAVCALLGGIALYVLGGHYLSAAVARQAREALHRERERAEVTLYSIADGVVTTDVEGRVEYLNPAAERLTGWQLQEARGRAVAELLQLVDEGAGRITGDPVQRCLRRGATVKLSENLSLISRSGRRTAVNESLTPLRDHAGTVVGVAIVLQDMGRDRELSHLLAYQAAHDDLTGLINRREFTRRVQQALESARRGGSHVLCHMDLDRFKVVNDTSGHSAGDSMLRQVARLLGPHVSADDTLARLDGDEFGILFEDCALDQAIAAAEGMVEAVKRFRFQWEDTTFEVGASIGLVPLTTECQSVAEAMSSSDAACYLAKEKGGNRVHVYQADDDALVKRRGELHWVHRITNAYSENRFVLFAQEILPLDGQGRDEKHYEILLRMQDEAGRLVLPMEYIAAAERYNMMFDLDRWVVTNAFRVIDRYVKRHASEPGLPMMRFAINLSGQSLGDDRTLAYVRGQFEAMPGLPAHIIFEITETAAVSNLAQAERFIQEFRELGCRFALDDFGSGVSSFSYLKELPVDYLKIDGQFVKDMDYDPVNFAMVGSINHIGHVMEIKTIAEYVESPQILERLQEVGVDFGQGSWLSTTRRLEEVV
ncbi:MAG: EAL domain-containing protein [Gammaproteobacteria bacterium]|nr:EAL domain-containing protein [Gammaproteobacteria bacterium]NIR97777.1 EAL domain-containing protein [Gammaproteobacteria bacterium]NIT63487.1 EAL domain-containing protein [Gammaproteobacteria bacterium]NIV20425.1 EAL domain-containing protein [Gammaproteobacteria bacterium]NIX10999.1 EAL domain-containing protein [Gammaproteobacteria bacterium]